MKMFIASIDVTKISKEKLYKGQKGTYCNVVIGINDDTDKFGNVGFIAENQSKEEREAKSDRVYLGNLKPIGRDGN